VLFSRKQLDWLRQLLTFIAVVSAFVANVLANVAPLRGMTIGEISNTSFQGVLITPANYAFAIWGIIYLGLISLAVYQVLPHNRSDEYVSRMGYSLVIASVAQIVWVYAFLMRFFEASFFVMLAILIALIWGYLNLNINRKSLTRSRRWFVQMPWSIYLAWISVATIVNGATALYAGGWSGGELGSEFWTIVMLVVGAIVSVAVTLTRRDSTFSWVVVWAFVAIAVRHLDTETIASVAGGLAVLIGAIALLQSLQYSKLKW